METVVIEIQSRYKDMTSSGIKETSVKVNQFTQSVEKAEKETKSASTNVDKFTQSIQKTQQQSKKATIDLTDLTTKMKNIASKVISIPVKVLDYATRPLRSIWNFATSLKGLITGFLAGQAWSKAVSGPLELADAYKSASIGFETLFKSKDRAKKMMNDLDEFARATPFKTAGVITQSQKMLAMGWNPDDIIKDMKKIGDAAAATGKGDEGLARISLALSQIKSKGKLSTEELNQLAEAGIGAKRYISEGLGLGTDDASLQKMSKMLEGGKIGADQAISYILKGMEEYNGMMEKTSKETLSGIKSNLADTFEINIFRKWGLGLQEGAKQGLGTLVDLLDQNQDKLSAFGDTLQGIGADISKYLADKFKDATEALMELTQSRDFKSADLFGKISLAWDKIVSQPFNKWWNSEGGTSFREKAETFGESIGNSLAKGAIAGFKSLLGNASKLLPGGEGADALSWLSAGALLKGANGLGVTKLLGSLGGKAIGAGAAESGAGLTVGLGAAAGASGAAIGGLGLISAINDMKEAAKTVNTKTKQDYMIQGATKAGMVAAGTALGAAIGSIIPGLGTLLGAGLGAGIGGLGALLSGGGLGKTISDAADGTTKLRELGTAAGDAKEKVTEAHTAAKDFAALVEQYKQVTIVVQLSESPANPTIEQGLKDRLTTIQEQAANIEAKLKDGGLNPEDKSNLQTELDGFNLQKITIKAVLGDNLGEDEKTKLTDRITELEAEKVKIDAELSDTTGLSEAEKTTLSVKKGNIEAQLIGIKAAVGILDTTKIDDDLAALQKEKEFLLKVKNDGMYDSLDDEFKKLIDKALSDNATAILTLQFISSGTNSIVIQGLKDELTTIQEQASNIEAKLKDGGLNKTDKANLNAELDELNLKEITIAAILGKTLDDTEKKKLTDRITEIEKEKIDIEAKLKGGGLNKTDKATLKTELETLNKEEVTINAMLGKTLDETEKTKLTDRITELEKEKVTVDTQLSDTTNLSESEKTTLSTKKANIEAELIGLKMAVGTLDTTSIDTQLANLQKDKEFLLNVKQGSNDLDASTRAMVDKALSDNKIATLALQVTASGLSDDEKQGYIDRIKEISAAIESSSGGLITQQSLLNDAYDTSIARLERILQLKEQEAKIADSQLVQNVYNNRSNGAGAKFETKLSEQDQKRKDDIVQADKYTEAATALQEWGQGVRDSQTKNQLSGVKGNDFGLTDDQNTSFNQKLVDLYQKYGNYFGASNPYSSGNYREYYEGVLGNGSPMVSGIIGNAQSHNLSAQQNEEQYYQTQSEYGNLYGNELEMIQRNLEKRYGGTYEDLSGKFFSGSDEDRNAFMKMVQSIESLGKMFPGLEEGFEFGGDQLVESLKPFITGDVVKAFAGRSKVGGTDPMSLLNNYIVDLSDKGIAGQFEADKGSVKDISSKVTGGTATKDEVKTMQDTLQKYGYDLGKSGSDGIVGSKTKAAMKQFQDDLDSGKLTLETLPDSVTSATTSIDGLSTAADAFAAWVASNIIGTGPGIGTDPLPGGGVTGTHAGVEDSGSSSGSTGSGMAGVLSSAADAVFSASANIAANVDNAASSVGTFITKLIGTANALEGASAKINNLHFGGADGKFASGGIVDGAQTALIGEDGPEAIIPLSEKRRGRGMSLWQKAGRALGVRMYADGGIVGEAPAAVPSGGASVDVGGVSITIEVNGGSDAESVVAALRQKMPEVANEVAEHLARKIEKVYSNMPVTEG